MVERFVERMNEVGQSERHLNPGIMPIHTPLNGEPAPANVQSDGDQNKKVAKRSLFKGNVRPRLSFSEKRDFRWWFWRKKGGVVRKKEYKDQRYPRGRYETHYILPGRKKFFRSWKKCVAFMGFDPDPSTTSWALERGDETGLAPVELVQGRSSGITRRKRAMRGQLTSPIIITTAGAPTSVSGTDPKIDNCVSVDPAGPVNFIESENATNPNNLLLYEESEDSSNHERTSLQGSLEAPDAFGYRNPRSKHCTTRKKSLIGNGELQLRVESAEGKEFEEQLQDTENAKIQGLSPQHNKTIISSVQNEQMNEINEISRRDRRILRLMLNSTSTGTSEEETTASDYGAKASTKVDNGKDEGLSTEHPRVIQQMSAKDTPGTSSAKDMAPPPGPAGRLKLACAGTGNAGTNVVSKENVHCDHTSEGIDHNKSQMNHSRENVHISYEESNCGPREQAEVSIVSVDDETLQKNLISLLYADHIKQPSKQTYGDVIGKLYAEFIERSFTRNQSSNSCLQLLAPAMTPGITSRKGDEQEVHDQHQSRQSNQIHGTLTRIDYTRRDKNDPKSGRN